LGHSGCGCSPCSTSFVGFEYTFILLLLLLPPVKLFVLSTTVVVSVSNKFLNNRTMQQGVAGELLSAFLSNLATNLFTVSLLSSVFQITCAIYALILDDELDRGEIVGYVFVLFFAAISAILAFLSVFRGCSERICCVSSDRTLAHLYCSAIVCLAASVVFVIVDFVFLSRFLGCESVNCSLSSSFIIEGTARFIDAALAAVQFLFCVVFLLQVCVLDGNCCACWSAGV